MATIRIVTDSTAGITEAQKEELGIATIPLVVRFGSDAYRDGVDISSGEFYERLVTGSTFPSTSQPSAGEFLELYRELAKDADSIISIHISSKLSGTCESARTAIREEIDANVDVVDSQSVAAGLGHLAVVAAEMARHGSDRDIIVQAINKLIPKVRIGFALTTMEYLKRGGRIGGAQAFVGSLLRIRPVLHLHDGRVEPLDRARSARKAVDRLIRYIDDESDGKLAYCGIVHVRNESGAAQLRDRVASRFDVDRWYEGELSPVVGAHAGPGVVGVCFPAAGD